MIRNDLVPLKINTIFISIPFRRRAPMKCLLLRKLSAYTKNTLTQDFCIVEAMLEYKMRNTRAKMADKLKPAGVREEYRHPTRKIGVGRIPPFLVRTWDFQGKWAFE